MSNKVWGVVIGAVVFLIGLVVLPWLVGMRTIEAGEVGVVTRFGKVTGKTLEPGLNWITPFVEDVQTYNTKKVTYETSEADKQKESKADYKDYPVDTNTADGQPVKISYTIRFSVNPVKATWVAQNIGNEVALVEKVVKTESRTWARNFPRGLEAMVLYTGEGSLKLQTALFDQLKPTFEINGLTLDFVGIREIDFDDQYVNAIKAKQVAAVQVETEKNKAEQETYKKQQRITQAEGQAKEQELQRQTISNELLQKMLIERWDGHYPQYLVTGGSSSFILPLPGSK